MRLEINLATDRYENLREFLIRWGAALVIVAAITVALGVLCWSSYARNVEARRRITDLKGKIAALDTERAAAEEILNRPENHDVREEGRFWNGEIQQRELSWTRLLADLEKIMPARTSVVSVEPKLSREKGLQLKLIIGGEKQDNLLELLSRMEKSDRFRSAYLLSEAPDTSGKGGTTVLFTIEASYVPAPQGQPEAKAKGGL
jgi:hypothetical protein